MCISLGKKLFAPKSSQTNTEVTKLAKAKGIIYMWIGIHDKANEGVFRYENSGQTITYTNWDTNEPNNAANREHCGQLYVASGKWNDNECSKTFAFVCESEGITSSYDPNAVIQSRINVCSDINEHEHSPYCEEALPVCDFSSKYRFVFSKSYDQN